MQMQTPKMYIPMGDAIIGFPADLKYLPGNTVVIQKGTTISITCRLNGLTEFPRWAAPNPQNVEVEDMRPQNGVYATELYISNISEEHNGQYECYRSFFQKKVFNIQVKVPTTNCSKFDEREFHIQYEKLQAANSIAVFSCKDENKKIVGSHMLICFSNGTWSDNPPRCQTMCPRLNESEGMYISYTDNSYEGSIALFHCLTPRVRTGVSHTTCWKGEWVDPMPTCTSMCPRLNESEGMYISYTDNLNEGSIAVFVCLPPTVITGVSHTTCRKGEWVDPVPTCTCELNFVIVK
ncbi:protein lev-9 [Caerostris darwini]|uniref:Protein lev-9 n=1 Tax=Caerostris darwini TaxID=1538125 RepID=A0AAV4RVS6_9ARAC|nr:protein lev-9 [Caerostris darwini]